MNFGTLSKKLQLDDVQHEELLSLLLSHFGHLSSHQLPGEYIFESRDNREIKLALGLNKKGKITSATQENISKAELDEIESRIIKSLIRDQTTKIAQTILFSTNLKIQGYFRYKDLFQILPIPIEAPHIDQLIGDHPFLLQYKYTSSSDFAINNARRKDKETFIARRLSFFTTGYIKHSPYYSSHAWVYEKELVDNDIVSRFAQEGYHWKGGYALMDSFTDTNSLMPIKLVESEKYYGYRHPQNQENSSLLLPDSMSTMLDKREILSLEDRTKFDRACSWYYQSHQIWLQSHSASFIAAVTALESLFDQSASRCRECGQPIYKISKTLGDFLDKYVPFISQFKRERKLLYETRSKLSHGLSMLSRDIEPGLFLKPIQQDEDTLQRNINHIVFVAIYNWLNSR
jgi:hypothetical protein